MIPTRMPQLVATALTLLGLISLVVLVATPAHAMPTPEVKFALAGSSLANLLRADPVITRHFMDSPIVETTGNEFGDQNQVVAGWTTSPGVKYESYAVLVAHTDGDPANGELEAGIGRVTYDPEQWDETPVEEQQNPPLYMRLFCERAHARGLGCGNAPARTLMQVPGSVYTCTGTLTERYLACNVAGDAARHADWIDVQMQAHQTVPTIYEANVKAGFADAWAANPDVEVRSNLSSALTGTTSDVLCTAHRLVADDFGTSPQGHWLHVSETTRRVGTAFLNRLEAGDC